MNQMRSSVPILLPSGSDSISELSQFGPSVMLASDGGFHQAWAIYHCAETSGQQTLEAFRVILSAMPLGHFLCHHFRAWIVNGRAEYEWLDIPHPNQPVLF